MHDMDTRLIQKLWSFVDTFHALPRTVQSLQNLISEKWYDIFQPDYYTPGHIKSSMYLFNHNVTSIMIHWDTSWTNPQIPSSHMQWGDEWPRDASIRAVGEIIDDLQPDNLSDIIDVVTVDASDGENHIDYDIRYAGTFSWTLEDVCNAEWCCIEHIAQFVSENCAKQIQDSLVRYKIHLWMFPTASK